MIIWTYYIDKVWTQRGFCLIDTHVFRWTVQTHMLSQTVVFELSDDVTIVSTSLAFLHTLPIYQYFKSSKVTFSQIYVSRNKVYNLFLNNQNLQIINIESTVELICVVYGGVRINMCSVWWGQNHLGASCDVTAFFNPFFSKKNNNKNHLSG